MAEERSSKAAGAGEEERPPMTAKQFEASPEFRAFKKAMKKLLRVSKTELDRRVETAKKHSPRAGNPNAPGRKSKVNTNADS
jgi:hypothetical protein